MSDTPDPSPLSPGRPHVLSSARVERAVQLLAMGTQQQEVARMLGVSRQTLWRYLKDPEVAEQLRAWRDTFKIALVQRAAEGTIQRAMDMADRAIDTNNPRDFDATARGIAALEKATASASGEAKRIEVDANVQAQAQVDTRALVAAILEHVQAPDVPRV